MIGILRWSFLILTHLLVISVLPGMLITPCIHHSHPPSPTLSLSIFWSNPMAFLLLIIVVQDVVPLLGTPPPPPFLFEDRRSQGNCTELRVKINFCFCGSQYWSFQQPNGFENQKFCCLSNIFFGCLSNICFGCLSNIFKLGGKSWEKGNWSSSWWEHLTHNTKCNPTPGGLYAATFMYTHIYHWLLALHNQNHLCSNCFLLLLNPFFSSIPSMGAMQGVWNQKLKIEIKIKKTNQN